MTPAKKKIWFVLIRAGTWFPAAEVYFTPDKTEGRLRTGEYRMIWRKDAERMLSRYDERDRYVQVMPPGAAGEESPRVPDIKWLPFHSIDDNVQDKQIVPLVDKVQQVRPAADDVFVDHDEPVSAIALEGDKFRVEVAWPDKGYEHYFMFKAGEKGFEFVEENTVFH